MWVRGANLLIFVNTIIQHISFLYRSLTLSIQHFLIPVFFFSLSLSSSYDNISSIKYVWNCSLINYVQKFVALFFPIHMLNYSHAQTHASFEMNQNQIKQLFWHINDFFQLLSLSLEKRRVRNSHKAYTSIKFNLLLNFYKFEDENFAFLGHFVHRHSTSIVIANWFSFS